MSAGADLQCFKPLESRWRFIATAPGEFSAPTDLPSDASWQPALVPGTVAGALRSLNALDLDALPPLTEQDYWYLSELSGEGPRILRFTGLATIAEVWLDDEVLLRSENMFLSHDRPVTLRGDHRLCLCFRALANHSVRPARRARWRPTMIAPGSLRSIRTTLLGHLPGWTPRVPPIGPWRAVEWLDPRECALERRYLRTHLTEEGGGTIDVRVSLRGESPARVLIECAGSQAALESGPAGAWSGKLRLDRVEPWWPHTHGDPHLYPVTLRVQTQSDKEHSVAIGRVGFRQVRLNTDPDGRGFALLINGVPVFCRGANWSSADIVGFPPTREAYQPWIERMRDAHMNMVRVSGTTVYEADAFYELCDEHGILVWQDFMFANFDYPTDDPQFAASCELEARQFLERTAASPALAVLCGGSEVYQQAAMLGLPAEIWRCTLFDEWLPAAAEQLRPDIPYITNSPFGGALPFTANAGVTHYYGVGAYERPLDDARRANVRFATECLAFANVPEPGSLATHLAGISPLEARWKARVPRDRGTSWDFEDVRDYYLQLLYRRDAAQLRREDLDRYLRLSRATSAEVMEATLAEWRRPTSVCAGALVWMLQDLWPGAGWGVLDSGTEPKAAYYALRRAFRPLQVTLTDEGVNGLAIHCTNDHPSVAAVKLEFVCYSGARAVASAARALSLAPRSAVSFSSAELLGSFFDVSYAYRFGPAAHEVAIATLRSADSDEYVADAFHFVCGRGGVRPVDQIETRLESSNGRWWLTLTSSTTATSVHIEDDCYRATDSWFHLAPRCTRRVELVPKGTQTRVPDGYVYALNATVPARYRPSR